MHLEALERKGHITRREGSSRSISLVSRAGSVSVPIVGTVRAGLPELATEDIVGFCQIDTSWLKGQDNFILKVKGDSMVEAGIFNGDYAIIRPQQSAENGEIVVALIDGEATLKRFYQEHDHIRLQPENTNMAPIIVKAGEADTMIAGRLIKTVRFFD
jgi:repressor LexA